MSYPLRLLLLLTFFFTAPLAAADNPLAKVADAKREALLKAGYTTVPLSFDPRKLYFYVDGAVGPEKAKFLLDSGCNVSILDLSLAKRLKLELGKKTRGVGAGGESAGWWTEVPGLMIGKYDTRRDWHELPIEATELTDWPKVPGVLGMDVLDKWAAVVDFPTRSLYLRPPLTTVWPKLAGTWTVTSWQENGEARKLDPKVPPTFTFADRRMKLTDGDIIRDFGIRFKPNDDGDYLFLVDPKHNSDLHPILLAGGLLKLKEGVMTACLALDGKAMDTPMQFAAPKGSGYVLLELKRTTPAVLNPSDPFRELLLKEGFRAVKMDREPGGWRMATAGAGRHELRLMVDTGATLTTLDTEGINRWGAEKLGGLNEVSTFGRKVLGEYISLRGITLGHYDTRRAFGSVYGMGMDLTEVNKRMVEMKKKPIQGVLGNFDLLNGSAVIDFGTNTLYLRPIKDTLWPQLEGKWAGIRYEADGRKGQYKPGDGVIEFKDGRIRFTTKEGSTEWGFHLRDEGDRYRLGLFDPKADELAEGFSYASKGALKLAGGTLTLVMEQGMARKEPTEFAAPAGSGLLLVEYERAK